MMNEILDFNNKIDEFISIFRVFRYIISNSEMNVNELMIKKENNNDKKDISMS